MAMALCSTRQRLSEVNPNGANYFMEKLVFQIYDHFDEQDLIDVTFKLSNPNALVTAHRLILSAASPFFKQLFKTDAGMCPVIEITEIDSESFERLITFCYTGKMRITIANVGQMLKAAMAFELDEAVTNCVDFLIEHITEYTLERIYALERETQCALLSAQILEYELENFMSVIQSPEFLNFEASKLQRILESDDLNVPTEKDAFQAVKRWYEHNASARKEQLPGIISCLRLTQFDTNFLLSDIQPLPGCHFVAIETLTWVGFPASRATVSLRFTNPRKQTEEQVGNPAFLAFNMMGGECRAIFQYNNTSNLWQKWTDIEMDVLNFRVVFMDDSLIFIGGRRNNKAVNEVSGWNFKTKTLQRLPSINQPRYWHAVVLLNDNIYAIGGKGANDEILRSVEMYSSNGWKSINSMIESRWRPGAVVLNEKIYVVGGENKTELKSVECYDPRTNCWSQCADMNEPHEDPGVTVHNGQIFVVGGASNGKCTKEVERYDPQRDEWTKICSLETVLQRPGCISIDNQLWAVGGYYGAYKNWVSVYDEQNDKWISKKGMPFTGFYYCFTAPKTLLQSEQQM